MRHPVSELLGGAALAAFLILPTALPGHGQAHAAAAGGGWQVVPARSFSAHTLKLDDTVAVLTIVPGTGPMRLEEQGLTGRVRDLAVRQEGDTLHLIGQGHGQVWNWHEWFDFTHTSIAPETLQLRLTVPAGTPVKIDGFVGTAQIGDTLGPLDFGAVATRARIGRVRDTHLDLAGSGTVDIAEVMGKLKLDIAGSAKVNAGRSGPVRADMAGAGDAHLGDINGGLKLDIAGSGTLSAQSVHGPLSIDIAGSGSVKIASGEANPLHVDIMGSGDLDFGGHAVNPSLEAAGSGRVRLKSYSGHLSTSGNVSLTVNGAPVHAKNDDDDGD